MQYDDGLVTYETILDWFWSHHDPTQKFKKQYESVIFYTDEEQKKVAEKSIQQIQVVCYALLFLLYMVKH